MTADPHMDQLQAATADAHSRILGVAEAVPDTSVVDEDDFGRHVRTSPIDAAVARWGAGDVYHCGHLGGGPRPAVGLLAVPDRVFCLGGCALAASVAFNTADRFNCDACRRPAVTFREIAVQRGLVIIAGQVCEACHTTWEKVRRG
ncbi:hypothetical protein [Micromonospora sediminicola]|uniref:hypothetical protein n=1 Tax=Micromonospora sediminicola TaxID=946078 RepID=UPI003791EF01